MVTVNAGGLGIATCRFDRLLGRGVATEDEDSDHYGRWKFLRDGATPGNRKVENWFELLDYWFDDTTKKAEGLNGYRW